MTSRGDLADLKRRVMLSEIVGRRVKLSRGKNDWKGLCPFHTEKTPSFVVNDRKGVFHCFGCGAHGDALDWWQQIEGVSFSDAVERLRKEAGSQLTTIKVEIVPEDMTTVRRQANARAIWDGSRPLYGTIAERYLRESRRIKRELPDCLRFHPGLRVDASEPGELPAMVAAVTDLTGSIVAIQRTFLTPDGSGKAMVDRPKRALGLVGQGAVCRGPAGPLLGLAEGIETGLAAMELFHVPVWCALGSNLARVRLPPVVQIVAILADRGSAGESAADKACAVFRAQGRKVAVRFAACGEDFNDELRARRDGR